ncbi:hypothetical protein RAS1_17750 [Phycisphaerae bacterium RAS1]|nr:hypothetical protein RAS1_17750 [Phycisphaerae bacterium RAS1]
MNINELPRMLLDTVHQHVSSGAAWMTYGLMGLVALSGLMSLIKGARMAPMGIATALAILAGMSGTFVAKGLNTPVVPTVCVTGVVGLLLGFAFFRGWLGLLMSACVMFAALSFYGGRVLQKPLSEYTSSNFDHQNQLVTLPGEAGTSPSTKDVSEELRRVWAYLSSREDVPNFQTTFWSIAGSSALAGLIFGLLLPSLTRAILAATSGSVVFFGALWLLAHTARPELAAKIDVASPWVWGGAAVVWVISLLYNFTDVRRPKTAKRVVEAAPGAVPA